MQGFSDSGVAVTPHPLVLSALPSKVTMWGSGTRPELVSARGGGVGPGTPCPGPLGSGGGKSDRWGGKAEFRSHAGTHWVGGPVLVTPLPSPSLELKGPPSGWASSFGPCGPRAAVGVDVGKASASGSSRWSLEGPDGPGPMPCVGAPPARGTRQAADSVASARGRLQASPGRVPRVSPAGSGPSRSSAASACSRPPGSP